MVRQPLRLGARLAGPDARRSPSCIATGAGARESSTAIRRHLLEEKKLIVNKSGLIQYVADGTQIDHVGGLEYLKKWLLERRQLFLERDSLAAEIVPKGVLVMGVSGCGKSLSVKAIASCFGLPLYRIDMVEVFSGRHGNPDAAFAEACHTVESLAPAVVWFDEIEMGLTGQGTEPAPTWAASSPSSSPGCRKKPAACSSRPPPTASTCCRPR